MVRSVGWLMFHDLDLRLIIALPVTGLLGIAMLIAGIAAAEAWMIIIGTLLVLATVGGLFAALPPKRSGDR